MQARVRSHGSQGSHGSNGSLMIEEDGSDSDDYDEEDTLLDQQPTFTHSVLSNLRGTVVNLPPQQLKALSLICLLLAFTTVFNVASAGYSLQLSEAGGNGYATSYNSEPIPHNQQLRASSGYGRTEQARLSSPSLGSDLPVASEEQAIRDELEEVDNSFVDRDISDKPKFKKYENTEDSLVDSQISDKPKFKKYKNTEDPIVDSQISEKPKLKKYANRNEPLLTSGDFSEKSQFREYANIDDSISSESSETQALKYYDNDNTDDMGRVYAASANEKSSMELNSQQYSPYEPESTGSTTYATSENNEPLHSSLQQQTDMIQQLQQQLQQQQDMMIQFQQQQQEFQQQHKSAAVASFALPVQQAYTTGATGGSFTAASQGFQAPQTYSSAGSSFAQSPQTYASGGSVAQAPQTYTSGGSFAQAPQTYASGGSVAQAPQTFSSGGSVAQAPQTYFSGGPLSQPAQEIQGTQTFSSALLPQAHQPDTVMAYSPAVVAQTAAPEPPPITEDGGLGGYKDAWDPHDPSDVPVFWHIPKAGGSTVKDIMGTCHRMTMASEAGIADGHGEETVIAVVKIGGDPERGQDPSPFVNVDTTTVGGLQRSKQLGLAQSGLADAIVTPFLYEANELFDAYHRGRLFTVFRHPVDRAISMFNYLQYADWEPTYNPQLATMSIEEYAQSGFVENNWLTRTLAQKPEGDLADADVLLAMDVVRRKFMVGLLTKKDETMERFEKYFGWKYHINPTNQENCRAMLLGSGANANTEHKKEKPTPGTPTYDLLAQQNFYDIQLYQYVETLFGEQEAFVTGIPDGYRLDGATCCKCEVPPTC